jgi:hypothetical protein
MLFAVKTQRVKVLAIRQEIPISDAQKEIAELAWDLWLARRFRRNGSPEECFLQAVLELTFRHGNRPAEVGAGFDHTPPEAA